MRRILAFKLAAGAATASLVAASLVVVAGPAFAAGSTTTATFVITMGTLGISVPATASDIATVATGATTASGALGPVTVTDTRGLVLNSWTATVTTTTFTTGGGSAPQTVAQTAIGYSSGASTATSGLGSFVPTASPPATIGTAGTTGATWSGLAGIDSATWDPTLTFTLLASQVAGTYTGTITHSVA